MRKFIKLILMLSISVGAVLIFLVWSFWEPSNIDKDSITYWLKVPDVAKTFPVWSEKIPARFDVRIADGEKPSTVVMKYGTSSLLEDIKYRTIELGFSCKQYESDDLICDKSINQGKSQQLIYQKNSIGDHWYVKVLFIGY